jgi:hypothetical protein
MTKSDVVELADAVSGAPVKTTVVSPDLQNGFEAFLRGIRVGCDGPNTCSPVRAFTENHANDCFAPHGRY